MAWIPLSRTVPQYENPADGSPYSGAVLKAYAAGTTTNINLATDNTGGTTVVSVALNSAGYPEVSGSVVIPHVDQDFKLALYPDQASADADSGAIWTVDAISVGQVTTEWVDSGVTPTYVSASQFTLAGDQTTEFHVGRRVRLTDGGGTDYATITSSAYTTETAITVSVDAGGALDAGLSAVDLAILSADNSALPGVETSEDDWTFQGDVAVEGSLTAGGSAVAGTVTTTRGDLIRRGESADERVALGSNGQVLASDGTDAAWANRITLNSEVATTSGTAVTIASSIPAWAKRITIMLEGVSTSGASPIELRLGDSGGFESSGYSGVCNEHGGSGTNVVSNSSGIILVRAAIAAQSLEGVITLTLKDAANNTWAIDSRVFYGTEVFIHHGIGFKSLSDALTQLQLTTSGGSDTFDAGDVAVQYD